MSTLKNKDSVFLIGGNTLAHAKDDEASSHTARDCVQPSQIFLSDNGKEQEGSSDRHSTSTGTLSAVDGTMAASPPSKPAVLFLCVHNAGRSQMGAGFLRHLAGDKVDVYSGGSEPGAAVNPAAVEAMAEVGVDISAQTPKKWTKEIVDVVDVVVSMGCGDVCPVLPGKKYVDWTLTDPAGQGLELVRTVRDDIKARVEELIASLGV